MKIFHIISVLFSTILESTAEKIKHNIFWNPDVNEILSKGKLYQKDVKIGEYMDIICPQYDVEETNIMTFVIYNVTKQVFDSCGKINEGAKLLLTCNKPRKTAKLTLKFQTFSPNPKGLVFYPGESYYLMSYTDKNEAIYSHRNCNDKMRMEIKVFHKKQHHNYQQKTDEITTVVRKSPKFSVTKPVDSNSSIKEKVISNQVGVFNDNGHPGSSSIMTSSNTLLLMTLVLTYYVTTVFNT